MLLAVHGIQNLEVYMEGKNNWVCPGTIFILQGQRRECIELNQSCCTVCRIEYPRGRDLFEWTLREDLSLNLIEKENNDEIIGEWLDLSSGHNVKQAYFVLFSLVLCVLVGVNDFFLCYLLKKKY